MGKRKVHKLNDGFNCGVCEGTHWRFISTPAMTRDWRSVTCRRCLAKKPKKGKRK